MITTKKMKLSLSKVMLTCLLLAGVYAIAGAQELQQLREGGRRPVLVDDINQVKLLEVGENIQLLGGYGFISNLSQGQHQQIKTLELAKQKQLNQLNNQLAEKKARLRTLEAQDKPDMKAINQTIDEQAKLMADKMKAEAECRQKVRAILTDEQRVEFDARR